MARDGIAGPDRPQPVDVSPSLKALVTPIQEPGVASEAPAAARSGLGPGPGSVAAPAAAKKDRPAVAGKRAAEAKRPYHLGIAFGAAAALYAGSLAIVTRLQIDHDQALIADRQPVRDAVELLGRHHDAMDANLSVAARAYDDTAGSYNQLVLDLADVHQDVASLTKRLRTIRRLAVVDGSGLSSLPRVVASGGSVPPPVKTGSRTSSKSAPPPPPPVDANTGASGG